MESPALFIVFEGGDGAGKTTQATRLVDFGIELSAPVDMIDT